MITNNFLAAGGDTYYAFAAASSQIESGLSLDTVVMDYITDELGGTVTKARYGEPQGRMTIIPPEKLGVYLSEAEKYGVLPTSG